MYYEWNPLSHLDRLREQTSGSGGSFRHYYPESAAGVYESRDGDLYHGPQVIWDGIEGHMVRVPAENVAWNSQNILDSDKLRAVAQGIEESRVKITLRAAWGNIYKVCLTTVRDSIRYARDDPHDVLTTGDDDLDEFLVDPETYIQDNYADPDDEPELYAEKMADYQEALKDAEANNEGDLGEWIFTPTDGHHRLFGALLAGEPYVWVMLADAQVRRAHRGEREIDRERAELLE